MIIEAVRNYVIFTFQEDINDGRFINSYNGSIIITSDDRNQTTHPRWGQVQAVGPEVDEIQIGDYILVDAGKWTSHFYVDGRRYWKTDVNEILCVSDEPGTSY